jgi:FdhE protein
MPDYSSLAAEWEAVRERRSALREPLGFWTAILEGWMLWKAGMPEPLDWSDDACRQRWERGAPLIAEAAPALDREAVEDLLGPVMERLSADGAEAAEALHRIALAWDGGEVGPEVLLPGPGRDPAAFLQERFGLASRLAAFLAPAGLRPALETWFERTRGLPEGVWTRGLCPWCGGFPFYGDLVEDGRRRLSCQLCGGAWMAPRLRCPICETWDAKDLVRLLAEEAEEGYFIEACRACRGYLKGVDRRQRWNAGSPLVEDWASPHLDVYAAREGYWRPTPCLVHLVGRGPVGERRRPP